MFPFLIMMWPISIIFAVATKNFTQIKQVFIDQNPTDQISIISPFISNFSTALLNSEELFKQFSLGIEDSKNYTVLHKAIYNAGIEFNSDDPDEFASTISESFYTVLDMMTPLTLGKAIAAAVEHILNDHGIMAIFNAFEFAEEMENSIINAGLTIGPVSLPGEYLKSIIDGLFMFVSSFNLASPEITRAFSKYLSNEFKDLKLFYLISK